MFNYTLNTYEMKRDILNFSNDPSFATEFDVYNFGYIYGYYVNAYYGARPVVSLSSKAKLLGNGTYSNPYTVS